MTADGSGTLGSPVPERGGENVDEAVATAEAGSQVEGVHTPSGQAASGESRLEQMPEVEGVDGPRVDVNDGAPVHDGPTFDTESDRTPQDTFGPRTTRE